MNFTQNKSLNKQLCKTQLMWNFTDVSKFQIRKDQKTWECSLIIIFGICNFLNKHLTFYEFYQLNIYCRID